MRKGTGRVDCRGSGGPAGHALLAETPPTSRQPGIHQPGSARQSPDVTLVAGPLHGSHHEEIRRVFDDLQARGAGRWRRRGEDTAPGWPWPWAAVLVICFCLQASRPPIPCSRTWRLWTWSGPRGPPVQTGDVLTPPMTARAATAEQRAAHGAARKRIKRSPEVAGALADPAAELRCCRHPCSADWSSFRLRFATPTTAKGGAPRARVRSPSEFPLDTLTLAATMVVAVPGTGPNPWRTRGCRGGSSGADARTSAHSSIRAVSPATFTCFNGELDY